MANPIELTREDINYIKKHHRKLGSGVDGEVYHIKGDILYKLYNETNMTYQHSTNELPRDKALYRALELQKHIKHTNLPQNIITMNNEVIGCTYKKYNTIFGIYAATIFPMSKRKEILSNLLVKIQELLDYNIYLVTLAQKNELLPLLKKDANILLNYNLEPLIIDLDGISAIYTEEVSQSHYRATLGSLSKLIFEILIGQDLSYEFLDENKDVFLQLSRKAGIDLGIAEDYYDFNYVDMETLNKVLKR